MKSIYPPLEILMESLLFLFYIFFKPEGGSTGNVIMANHFFCIYILGHLRDESQLLSQYVAKNDDRSQ